MPYQSFVPGAGSSRSHEKLAALRLPDLAGLTVLDLGCNEGFFCFAALDAGAASVTGIDKNPRFLDAARAHARERGLPEERARFLERSWDDLPEGAFDVILLTSALHYAADQEAFIARIAGKLSPGGLFVFEGGVIDDPGAEPWTTVARGKDGKLGTVLYPSRARFEQVLARHFAPRRMGPSVAQGGDPVPRVVYHGRKLMRTVLALSGKGASGKSTLAGFLRARSVPVVASDALVTALAADGGDLGRLVAPHVRRGQLGRSYRDLVAAGLAGALAREALDRLLAAPPAEDLVVFEGALLTQAPFAEALARECERRHVVLWVARREVAPAAKGAEAAEAPGSPGAPGAVPAA